MKVAEESPAGTKPTITDTTNKMHWIMHFLFLFYDGSYMFRQNNAILRKRLCSFLSHFSVNIVGDKSEYNKIIQ
jgi:hypothetical protein